MKKLFQDFKAFISKGNVLNLAVGIIIGGAFNAIITSLVNDVIMPPVSLLLGDEVSLLKWVIRPETLDNAGLVVDKEIAIRWGMFVQQILNFLIVAVTLFIVIRVFSALQARADALAAKIKTEIELKEAAASGTVESEVVPEPEPVISEEVLLLREIRDSLAKK